MIDMSRFQIIVKQLSSASCLLDIQITDPQTGDELRGYVVGPFSKTSSTIELVYKLKLKGKSFHQSEVAIPEPNFWSESNPLEYRAILELLSEGQKVHHETIVVQLKLPS